MDTNRAESKIGMKLSATDVIGNLSPIITLTPVEIVTRSEG